MNLFIPAKAIEEENQFRKERIDSQENPIRDWRTFEQGRQL
jgi:hypothetical protein